jgi:hypothetical protein
VRLGSGQDRRNVVRRMAADVGVVEVEVAHHDAISESCEVRGSPRPRAQHCCLRVAVDRRRGLPRDARGLAREGAKAAADGVNDNPLRLVNDFSGQVSESQ